MKEEGRWARLEIGSTWDGQPVSQDERAKVVLRLVGSALAVSVEAPFHGDPPPPGPAGPTDGLWRHEVVELFVVGLAASEPQQPLRVLHYVELELSPHGHFLLLAFSGRRRRVRQAAALERTVDLRTARWRAEAVLSEEWLPPSPWAANAFALHGQGDGRRYLAAYPLPGEQPDFHQVERFPPLLLGSSV